VVRGDDPQYDGVRSAAPVKSYLTLLLALAIVFAMFITARPSCAPPPVDVPTTDAPDPFAIALGILFLVGLVARYRASRRDPRTAQQRKQLRPAADDIPIHPRRRASAPRDPDPALPFPLPSIKAKVRFRCGSRKSGKR